MKRLMFLVAAVLACHSMQAQYFCTTEGTELHYVNYDEIGQSTSDETMTVSKVEKVDGNFGLPTMIRLSLQRQRTIPAILCSTGATMEPIQYVRKI